MDAKEQLYAEAAAEYRKGRRRHGWSVVVLMLLAVLFGGGAESTFDEVCAWLASIGAFACFARYAGDSKELESLDKGRRESPPGGPVPPPNARDEAAVNAYGAALSRYAGRSLVSTTHLPMSKAALKGHLAPGIKHLENPYQVLVLEEGYLRLASFQPLLPGNEELATMASALEYLELTRELAAIKAA